MISAFLLVLVIGLLCLILVALVFPRLVRAVVILFGIAVLFAVASKPGDSPAATAEPVSYEPAPQDVESPSDDFCYKHKTFSGKPC